MDRNALDWIFSTLPQALAALSGLIFAGVTFRLGQLENKETYDNSLIEIMDAMKSNIHKKLSSLFWVCGSVIMLDVVVMFSNPIRDGWVFSFKGYWDWYYTIVVLLFCFNLYALYKAISFVVTIVNPNYTQSTIDALKKEYKIKQTLDSSYVEGIDFLRLFQDFEKGLTHKVNRETKDFFKDKQMSIYQIFDFLYKQRIINHATLNDLKHVNAIRNVLAHGSIDEKVPKDSYDILEKLSKSYLSWDSIRW